MKYEDVLIAEALSDERFIVLTAENRALIRNIPAHPQLSNRFFDTGITEQTMIGIAAGLALRGRIPIVHALSAFLTMRAFEFIRTDIGLAGLPVKLTGFIPGFLSDGNGPTHQAIEDIGLMHLIPSMQIFCPADEEDMAKALPSIWNSPCPTYVRAVTQKALIAHAPFEIGKAEVIAQGNDVTLLTYGMLFSRVFEARQILSQKGLSVGLINMRSIRPLDERAILSAGAESDLLVIVEDHLREGGLTTKVVELLFRNGVYPDVHSISLDGRYFRPGRLSEVLTTEGFTATQIAQQALTALETKPTIYARK